MTQVWGRICLTGERHHRVGDGADDPAAFVVGELLLEVLDLDEWHDASLVSDAGRQGGSC